MLSHPDYEICERLAADSRHAIYAAQRTSDRRPVILKTLSEGAATADRLASLKREYEILRRLDSVPGAIQACDLIVLEGLPALVLEDFGAASLTDLKLAGRLSVADWLELAIAIVTAVGQIHAARIIHKDLNPQNIVRNPETGQVKLIDFELATDLQRQEMRLAGSRALEGTLAYIAPEQTGRTNRAVDYRSDFYSLGASFYELLTGQPPFSGRDALELVHAHVAKQPLPPA